MKSNKNVLFDKEYVKIKKDTFDTMNKVIDDATNVMNLQPKLEKVYKEVDSYTKSYQSLKRENILYENEIKVLELNNNKLDEKIFKKKDVVNISVDTIKEYELFDYVGYPRYYGIPKYNELDDDYEYNKNKDDDFDLSL